MLQLKLSKVIKVSQDIWCISIRCWEYADVDHKPAFRCQYSKLTHLKYHWKQFETIYGGWVVVNGISLDEKVLLACTLEAAWCIHRQVKGMGCRYRRGRLSFLPCGWDGPTEPPPYRKHASTPWYFHHNAPCTRPPRHMAELSHCHPSWLGDSEMRWDGTVHGDYP